MKLRCTQGTDFSKEAQRQAASQNGVVAGLTTNPHPQPFSHRRGAGTGHKRRSSPSLPAGRDLGRGLTCIILLLLMCLPVVVLAQDTGDIEEDPCAEIAPPGVLAVYFVGQGDAYFTQGNYTLAITAYTCALDQDPEYAPAYVNRGFAHAIQRNYPQALEDYNRALEIDESLVGAYNNRGLLYTYQGNFGLAITDFTLAIALNPDSAVAYNNRAVVHAIEGNHDLAIADLEQAIALDPEYAAPHASLGAVYSAMAVESYQNYRDMAGQTARLPAGDADIVLNMIDDSRETGNFSVWLPLLTPAR